MSFRQEHTHAGPGLIATEPPDEWKASCYVTKRELRRVRDDVRMLRHRIPGLPLLQRLALVGLAAAGAGVSGLATYYASDPRPAGWLEIFWWVVFVSGLVGALILWLWGRSRRSTFEDEIERIAGVIETLDY